MAVEKIITVDMLRAAVMAQLSMPNNPPTETLDEQDNANVETEDEPDKTPVKNTDVDLETAMIVSAVLRYISRSLRIEIEDEIPTNILQAIAATADTRRNVIRGVHTSRYPPLYRAAKELLDQ